MINSVYIKGLGEYKIIMHPTFGHASDCLGNAWTMICPNYGLRFVSNGQNSYFEDLKLLRPNASYVVPLTLKK